MKTTFRKLALNKFVAAAFITAVICLSITTGVAQAQGNQSSAEAAPPASNANMKDNSGLAKGGPNAMEATPGTSFHDGPTKGSIVTGSSAFEYTNSLMVLTFSLITMFLLFFLLKKNDSVKPEEILRVFGVTLVITGACFFVSAGFSASDIAPALGLFGTIAGYLLGKTERRGEKVNV